MDFLRLVSGGNIVAFAIVAMVPRDRGANYLVDYLLVSRCPLSYSLPIDQVIHQEIGSSCENVIRRS